MAEQPLAAAAEELPPLPTYRAILLAADSSDHANRAAQDAVALARLWDGGITGIHVYAAKLHDQRFRQMEGGLPERYREERELEHQREVHDTLITRGLSVISDAYLDQVGEVCRASGISVQRRAPEGKNYCEILKEAAGGEHDLLVLGARGLGATGNAALGTVCQRVARRSPIDTLIIKDPERTLSEGPILVAVDGSEYATGGLLSALSLASHWQVPVHVVAAFDPYFHYVAFNRIAGVLSEEAGKVFKFQEQERLHEEIIDAGLARIYRGHLEVAKGIAADYGIPVETKLLDGKPADAIARYAASLRPSLLVAGKTGIHADADLDIGGNTEHWLREVDCAVLLSHRSHRPEVEKVAAVTTSWTEEAEARMERVPSFVRPMARMAILRYAQEHGHTVITERLVEEATAVLMPHPQGAAPTAQAQDARMPWSSEALALLDTLHDGPVRESLQLRAEKKARQEGAETVDRRHLLAFFGPRARPGEADSDAGEALNWEASALARLARVPEGFMREASRRRIEALARSEAEPMVTLPLVERALEAAREAMGKTLKKRGRKGAGHPAPDP